MMRCNHNEIAKMIDISETKNKYYLSIKAKNKMGVIGKIGTACGNNNISVESIVQKELKEDCAQITVITELCKEKSIQKLIEILENDDNFWGVNSLIRVWV